MLSFATQIFDDIIEGTGNTWYTPATYNDLLGSSYGVKLHAVTTDVSGSPGISCYLEYSSDGRHWQSTSSGPSGDATEGGSLVESAGSNAMLTFGRIAITFTGGTSPKCRLRLYAAGRNMEARATRPATKPPGGCGC